MREKIILYLKLLPLDILLFLKGIGVKLLKPRELDEVGRLRKKIYVNEGYVEDSEMPDVWTDDYDEEAVNFAAFKKGKIVGILRLINESSSGSLPIEKFYRLKNSLPKKCAEVSKFMIDKDFRGGKRLATYGLIKKAFYWSIGNGKEYWVGVLPERLCTSFRKFKADFRELETLPAGEKELNARNILKKYFAQPDIKPYLFDLKKIISNNTDL